MSTIQSGSRRHSARLQQKEDSAYPPNGATANGGAHNASTTAAKAQTSAANRKKRKNYDEDDDGFVFSRVKNKKPRQSTTNGNTQQDVQPTLAPVSEVAESSAQPRPKTQRASKQTETDRDPIPAEPQKKQRKRMSFSTPGKKEEPPVRRSKRLSVEAQDDRGSPAVKAVEELRLPKVRKEKAEKHKPPAQKDEPKRPADVQEEQSQSSEAVDESHSATKISLPFADTPVISRNKAMREGRGSKGGERRSSLGLRGRRASSLIETGNSNALPHNQVEAEDFYKHIESDVMEPRRMRQLLTWCATRAMHPKPQGTSFEEASARSAARVIEEELLKDLANKSDLSDWFSREDAPAPVVPLPERPNPKNTQNSEKISELEEQIKRLRSEKDALESLLRPPSIPAPSQFKDIQDVSEHSELLSESDTGILHTLNSSSIHPEDLSSRVNNVTSNLGPAIDTFADGIHKINQYRMAADVVASEVLSICAEKLSERERAGRKKALGLEEDRSPGRDLSSVLRGLSKTDS